MTLFDQQSQESLANVASVTAKASTAALTGQLLFGYTINEITALVGMTIAVTQFVYWIYEKFFKESTNGCNVESAG